MPGELLGGFSFRGVHSSKFGIFIRTDNAMLAPPRREDKIIIPGRHGYYDGVNGKVYNERTEKVYCKFVCPADKTVPETCREIARWLSGSGRFIYDKEPDKYYIAKLTGAPPVKQLYDYCSFSLPFSFNPPFAFGKTVTADIASGVNTLDYDGTQETPCIIVLKNTSATNAATVTITAVKRSM